MKMNKNFLSKEIKEDVLHSLEERKSLFMLRMGDGEMILAYNVKDKIPYYCNKQFGRLISDSELKKAEKWLEESVLESSILGLPDPVHINANSLWRILFDYYENLQKKNPEGWKKNYCSINSHFEILKSGDLFEILRNVEKVVIVSPRDIGEKLKQKFQNIKEIEYYSLPGEQAYETEKNTRIDIFVRIEEICSDMKSKSREGELLIFGAGPLGKIIGAEFSKSGGVSLDLGSVFDLFVGKLTRGKGKSASSMIDPIL